MALRSTLDIDINDEKWKTFNAAFEKYQGAVNKLPGAWQKLDKQSKSTFEAMVAAMLAAGDANKKIVKAEDEERKTLTKNVGLWKDIVKNSKTVLSNVRDTAVTLAKWSTIGGGIIGLATGAGLFGLDALAAGTGNQRRSALGLGVTIGQQASFRLNYGRLLDPDSYLSNVNAALNDVTKRAPLYGAGLTDSDLRGGNTIDVAQKLLPLLKRLVDRTPQALLAQTLQSRGLDQFISLQDAERLRNTSTSELGEYARNNRIGANALAIEDKTAKAWQDFDVKLRLSGDKLENVLVNGLVKLAGPLGDLSDSIAKSIQTLTDNGTFKKWITEAGVGVEHFAKWVSGPDFQKDLKTFADDVADVGEGLVNALRWLHLIPGTHAEQAAAIKKNEAQIAGQKAMDKKFDQFFAKPIFHPSQWLGAAASLTGTAGNGTVVPVNKKGPWGNQLTEVSVQAWLKKSFPGLIVTGGARTPEHNAELDGSAKNSLHLKGQAVDLKLPSGVSFAQFAAVLKSMGFPISELFNEGRHGKQGPHVHLGWGAKPGHSVSPPVHKVEIAVNNNTGGNATVSSAQLRGPAT